LQGRARYFHVESNVRNTNDATLTGRFLNFRLAVCLVVPIVLAGISSCGGSIGTVGSGSTSGTTGSSPSQPSASFALAAFPGNVTVKAGATVTITVSVTGNNGFNSPVTVGLSLPQNVTATPASLQISPGAQQQITLAASSAFVSSSSVGITVSGVSGSLTSGTSFTLNIEGTAPVSNTPTFRTRYVRTDAATEYFTALNAVWMIYNSGTNRFFLSDPDTNRVIVLDAAKEAEIATIPVPGALGIDQTPDGSLIYAGTEIGDVYAIDPIAMQVKHRYLASQIGPQGFQANIVRVLASGKLAMLGGAGGIVGVDGYSKLGVWDPATNALAVYVGGGQLPSGPPSNLCVSNIGTFTLTGDRSLIIVGSIDSDGTICTLNPSTGKQVAAQSGREFLQNVAVTPDGKSILIPSGYTAISGAISVLDTQTLSKTATFPVLGDVGGDSNMIVSPDSKTLYMNGSGIIYAYNLANGALAGWMPALTVENSSGGAAFSPASGEDLQAFDSTGLLAGPMEEGAGFLDTTTLRTGPVGTVFLNDYISPPTGSVAGGSAVQWENVTRTTNLSSVYFGSKLASSVSVSSNEFTATTPPGVPGPADVYSLTPDGGMLVMPEGYSYGPTILEVTPDSATAEGGGTGIVFGYGFGPYLDNAPIPANLQLFVDGKPATITGFAPNAYGLSSSPFPLQAVTYKVPSGIAGASADVEVATGSGTATSAGAIHYLPAMRQFFPPGASLAQGVYDSKRNVYYFTDVTEIQVFSRAQGQWLAPIHAPAPPPGKSNGLWGIALSPDGSQLAVSDQLAGKIYLINPDTGAAQSFPVNNYFSGSLENQNGIPAGLAVSDSGVIYYAAFSTTSSTFDGFFKLDTHSGQVTDYKIFAFGGAQYRVAISPDNATVYFNNDGQVFSVNTATDAITQASIDQNCCYGNYDLTISANGGSVAASSYIYDSNLNAQSYFVLNDREQMGVAYLNGSKFSPDGKLFFQPSTNGIDVYDGRLGTLRTRVSLPTDLAELYDPLVSDGSDNVLVAIVGQNGNSIAVFDLTSLAEPTALPYKAPTSSGTPQVDLGGPAASSHPLPHIVAKRTSALQRSFGRLGAMPITMPNERNAPDSR